MTPSEYGEEEGNNPFPEDDSYQDGDKKEKSIYLKGYLKKRIMVVPIKEGKLEKMSKKQTF